MKIGTLRVAVAIAGRFSYKGGEGRREQTDS